MKSIEIALIGLLLSTTVLTMKSSSMSLEAEASEQTSMLLKGANKLLGQKNDHSQEKILQLRKRVFNKVPLKE